MNKDAGDRVSSRQIPIGHSSPDIPLEPTVVRRSALSNQNASPNQNVVPSLPNVANDDRDVSYQSGRSDLRPVHRGNRNSLALHPISRGSTAYEKVKDIGIGSFGKAVLVKEKTGKQYVMKVIETDLLGPKERRDAVNEVQVLSSLKHPYIISYKESFVEDGRLCIIMDYADGGDLYRTISMQKKRGGKGFPEEQIVRWFTQATLALKYLHDKHILHRDLKSQNMFLMASGRLRLGDFGIAKVLDGTIAFTKTQIGTPYYLSPEICKNKPYSWASDIWSLGCILYELATLRVPFDAPNIGVLLDKITRHPPPQLPDSYSMGLRRLYNDCMQQEWRRRPSASEILLRDIVQNEIRRMLLEEQEKRQNSSVVTSSQESVSTVASTSSSASSSTSIDSRPSKDKQAENLSSFNLLQPKRSMKKTGQSNLTEQPNCNNPLVNRIYRVTIKGDTEVPTPPPPPLNTQRPKIDSKQNKLSPIQIQNKTNLFVHTPEKPSRSVSPQPSRIGTDFDCNGTDRHCRYSKVVNKSDSGPITISQNYQKLRCNSGANSTDIPKCDDLYLCPNLCPESNKVWDVSSAGRYVPMPQNDVWERLEQKIASIDPNGLRSEKVAETERYGDLNRSRILRHSITPGVKHRRGSTYGVTSNGMSIRINSRLSKHFNSSRPNVIPSKPSSFNWIKRLHKKKVTPNNNDINNRP